MPTLPGMEFYAARLESFSTAHPASKRRASTVKNARTITWPHETPTPHQLAKAGFFYLPTATSSDNVSCFHCQKGLDGWEEHDNPIHEHLNFSPGCAWALNMRVEQDTEDGVLPEDDPASEHMVEARRATFTNRWPHDGKRGWVCKTPKMVEAGWYHCPTEDSDDYVKCAYCSLGLDGWEPKDNPYNEHKRRSPECQFFNFSAANTSNGARRARPSRLSHLSTSSRLTLNHQEELIDVDGIEEDNNMTSTTDKDTATAPVKGAGKKASKAKKAKGGKKAKASVAAEPAVVEEAEPEDDDFEVKVTTMPGSKRGQKRTSDQMEAAAEEEPSMKRRATRSRRSTVKPDSSTAASSFDLLTDVEMAEADDVDQVEQPISKKAVKGGRKRASTTRKVSTASKAPLRSHGLDDEEIDDALEADLARPLPDDEEMASTEQEKPAMRRLTRTKPAARKGKASIAPTRRITRVSNDSVQTDTSGSSGVEKPEQAAVEVEKELPKPTKPTKARKNKKAAKQSVVLSEDELENVKAEALDNEENTTLETSKPKAARQPRNRRASKKEPGVLVVNSITTDALPVEEDAPLELESTLMSFRTAQDDSGHETDVPTVPKTTGGRSRLSASVSQPIKSKSKKAKKESIQSVEIHINETTTMPEAAPPAIRQKGGRATSTSIQVKAPKKGKKAPLADASSNKIETSNVETVAVAVAVAAELEELPPAPPSSPFRPKSPTTKFGLSSPTPSAQSSDIENQPPSSRPSQTRPPLSQLSPGQPRPVRVAIAASTPTKPKASTLQTTYPWEPVDLDTVFDGWIGKECFNIGSKALDPLTSPEKRMTVEEWIQHNAQQGEHKLRSECERIVGRFESEGVKALKALEGITCI